MIQTSRRSDRLERLALNGLRGQWSAEQAIDWDLSVRLPAWLPREDVAKAMSQLYHGEVATGRLCRRLLAEVAEPEARSCLELQIADESRHAAVYMRYLERLGHMAPVDSAFEAVLEDGLAWSGSALGMVVLFHVVVEGEALRLLDGVSRILPCPLLRQINRRISLDEARHVAFGQIYLRDRVAELPEDERRRIYYWVRELWTGYSRATFSTQSEWNGMMRRLFQGWLRQGWERHMATLAEIGLLSGRDSEARWVGGRL